MISTIGSLTKRSRVGLGVVALGLSVVSAGMASAATVSFTDDEGFADGNVAGQVGWGAVFGPSPLFNVVDAAGDGGLVQAATGGAVSRTFSDAEAGQAFDGNSTIVTYTLVYEAGAINPSPTFSGIGYGFGESIFTAAELDLGIVFRDDGRISIEDGVLSGNDKLLGGFTQTTEGETVTLTVTMDYSNNTYSASRSDVPGGDRAGFSFDPGTTDNPYFLRVDSSQSYDMVLDSIEITAVPEPGSLALAGLGGTLLMLRKRK